MKQLLDSGLLCGVSLLLLCLSSFLFGRMFGLRGFKRPSNGAKSEKRHSDFAPESLFPDNDAD